MASGDAFFLDEACLTGTPIDAPDMIRKHDARAFFHVDRNFSRIVIRRLG